MSLKHALSILLSRFTIIFKIILYFVVVMLIFVTIAGSALAPTIRTVKSEIENTGVFTEFKEGFVKLTKGDSDFTESFQRASASLGEIAEIFTNNRTRVIWAIAIVMLFVLLAAYVMTLSYVSFSDIINHFMCTNSRFGFLSNFISNLKRSLLYGLMHLLTVSVSNILIGYFLLFLTGVLLQAIGILCAPIILTLGVLLYSLKSTVFAGWLPAIVHDNKKVLPALVAGIRTISERGSEAFLSFVMMHSLALIMVIVFSFTTFGAGLIIAIPTVMMFHRTLELVLYYNANEYKYYVDNEKVIKISIYK
ncbi:MAG: hypothetical protein EOM87_04060 [Clostridia bacterium]|nr:hypothetical protein [Clostridia bacterium]